MQNLGQMGKQITCAVHTYQRRNTEENANWCLLNFIITYSQLLGSLTKHSKHIQQPQFSLFEQPTCEIKGDIPVRFNYGPGTQYPRGSEKKKIKRVFS